MKLIRYEKPQFGLTRLDDWFRNSDRFINFRNWPSFFGEGLTNGLWEDRGNQLGADLYEDDDGYYARFELPGVKKDDVKIELHNTVLTVSYEWHDKSEDGSESSETYSRSISVPDGVNFDRISAKHEDGLLTVTLPKAEAKKPRAIEVK